MKPCRVGHPVSQTGTDQVSRKQVSVAYIYCGLEGGSSSGRLRVKVTPNPPPLQPTSGGLLDGLELTMVPSGFTTQHTRIPVGVIPGSIWKCPKLNQGFSTCIVHVLLLNLINSTTPYLIARFLSLGFATHRRQLVLNVHSQQGCNLDKQLYASFGNVICSTLMHAEHVFLNHAAHMWFVSLRINRLAQ